MRRRSPLVLRGRPLAGRWGRVRALHCCRRWVFGRARGLDSVFFFDYRNHLGRHWFGLFDAVAVAANQVLNVIRSHPPHSAHAVVGGQGRPDGVAVSQLFPIEIACRPRSLDTIDARSTPAFPHTFQHAMSKFAGLFGHRRSEGNPHGGEPPPPHDATEGVSFCEPPMRTGFEDTVSASPRDQGRSAAQCEE